MARKLIQDIIVKKNKDGAKTTVCVVSTVRNSEEDVHNERPIWVSTKKKNTEVYETAFGKEPVHNNGRKILWLLAVLMVAILVFVISSLFSSAEVTVIPDSHVIELNTSFKISKDPALADLTYDVVQLERSATRSVVPDSEENVERKATGKAILYNEYSDTKQRLKVNTRLEAANGLTYRIRDSIDVPGYKIVGGKKVPGSIEVNIIADEAGEKFNLKMTDLKGDFTIPGLKATPRYEKFYARLSSDISGGFIGMMKIVSDEKMSVYKKEIGDQLTAELLKEFISKKPDGYIYFNDLALMKFDDNEMQISETNEITEKAVLMMPIFESSKIASVIAKQNIKDFAGEPVYPLFDEGVFTSITGRTIDPMNEDTQYLNLKGTLKIVRSFDIEKMKALVAGVKKSAVEMLVNSEFGEEIKNVSINVRPQWNLSLPKNINDIKVNIAI